MSNTHLIPSKEFSALVPAANPANAGIYRTNEWQGILKQEYFKEGLNPYDVNNSSFAPWARHFKSQGADAGAFNFLNLYYLIEVQRVDSATTTEKKKRIEFVAQMCKEYKDSGVFKPSAVMSMFSASGPGTGNGVVSEHQELAYYSAKSISRIINNEQDFYLLKSLIKLQVLSIDHKHNTGAPLLFCCAPKIAAKCFAEFGADVCSAIKLKAKIKGQVKEMDLYDFAVAFRLSSLRSSIEQYFPEKLSKQNAHTVAKYASSPDSEKVKLINLSIKEKNQSVKNLLQAESRQVISASYQRENDFFLKTCIRHAPNDFLEALLENPNLYTSTAPGLIRTGSKYSCALSYALKTGKITAAQTLVKYNYIDIETIKTNYSTALSQKSRYNPGANYDAMNAQTASDLLGKGVVFELIDYIFIGSLPGVEHYLKEKTMQEIFLHHMSFECLMDFCSKVSTGTRVFDKAITSYYNPIGITCGKHFNCITLCQTQVPSLAKVVKFVYEQNPSLGEKLLSSIYTPAQSPDAVDSMSIRMSSHLCRDSSEAFKNLCFKYISLVNKPWSISLDRVNLEKGLEALMPKETIVAAAPVKARNKI